MGALNATCALVERAAIALAKSHGLDFNERCGLEVDPLGECDSDTCVAAWQEDHDASLCRDQYRRDARAVLAVVTHADVEAAR